MIKKKDLKKFLKSEFLLNDKISGVVIIKEKLFKKFKKNIIQKSSFTECKINHFEFWRVVFKK